MINIKKLISPELKRRIKIYLHKAYRMWNGSPLVITNLHVEEIGDSKSDIFFGYYDISPYNLMDEVLLYHKKSEEKIVNICTYDLHEKHENCIAESKAWNWQQGSRLRWYNENSISFNDYKDEKYINRIINIETREEREIEYPLYDISPDRKLGLTLNFERLGYLRPGYGYRCKEIDPISFGNQGIDIVSLDDNKVIYSIELSEIHKLLTSNVPLDKCYVNHLSFSPDSTSFLFFFIEIIDGYHKASLVVYEIQTSRFTVLEKSMKVSHYVWSDNETILCSAYSTPNDCKYYSYDVSHGKKEIVLPELLSVDGHPSYLDDNVILTDTYPDSNGYQRLYTVDIKNRQEQNLLRIYSIPVLSGERRTDLHPRINHGKTKICIDVCVKIHRKIYEIELK